MRGSRLNGSETLGWTRDRVWNAFIAANKSGLDLSGTGNLRPVQLLLGHNRIESTVRYLGIVVDDALAIAQQIDIGKIRAGRTCSTHPRTAGLCQERASRKVVPSAVETARGGVTTRKSLSIIARLMRNSRRESADPSIGLAVRIIYVPQ